MTISYKTNKHVKNKSTEERLERAISKLESMIEIIDPEDGSLFMFPYGAAGAENLDDVYKQVCNCIQMLERLRAWVANQANQLTV